MMTKKHHDLRITMACVLGLILMLTQLSLFVLPAPFARAAEELFPSVANITITEAVNGEVDLIRNPDSTVQYGDNITFRMNWTIENGLKLTPNQPYLMQLPGNMKFTSASGDLSDGNKVLGSYKIMGSQISITYSNEEFCDGDIERIGGLTFEGRVMENAEHTKTAADVKVIFPAVTEFTFHMIPPEVTPALEISKEFSDVSEENPYHIYNCLVVITAVGDHTNVVFDDEMWPGMYLYSSPKYYSDTVAGPETLLTNVTDTSPAPGEDVRRLHAVISSMDHGDKVYVRYQVKALPDMYAWDSAQVIAGAWKNFYPYTYGGNIPNRADAWSDQVPYEQHVTAWADIRTLRAAFGKWGNPKQDDFEHGLIGWQIAVYSIYEYPKTNSGFIKDRLPAGNTLPTDSIHVTVGGKEMENAISPVFDTDEETGDTIVYLNFSKEMVDYLKSSEDAEAVVSYQTKVNRQEKDTDRYYNVAELFYDGVSRSQTGSDVDYTKPDAVTKEGNYSRGTAPYARYEIRVNPAALDLDPNGDEVILVDEMCDSFDLKYDSVLINGAAPEQGTFDYDLPNRRMTFQLKDSTAYVITYDAKVNLAPDTQFTDSNSGNSAYLYVEGKQVFDTVKTFDCLVYESAGSSSSHRNSGLIHVIKHAEGDFLTTLKGAEFTLTAFSYDDDSDSFRKGQELTGTTGDDGTYDFGDLTRGVVYLLRETNPPSGYDADETLRFYAFDVSGTKLPAEISYEGKDHPIQMIGSDKISSDVYVANTKSKEKPEPTSAEEPTSTEEPASAEEPTGAQDPANETEPTGIPASVEPSDDPSTGDKQLGDNAGKDGLDPTGSSLANGQTGSENNGASRQVILGVTGRDFALGMILLILGVFSLGTAALIFVQSREHK